jgi:NAD(P)-dependent dehydrogenase (short-subunit alcohol dehydrogenase family)
MQHTSAANDASRNATPVALVSGAASGIGQGTVRALSAAGWTVYAGYRPDGRSPPPPQTPPHDRVHWLALDVTDATARRAALALISAAHGRLDALVNTAGFLAAGPLEELPERTLRAVMEVNFFGALGLTRTFLPLMRGNHGGVIVMVSSLSGLIGLPFDGAYAASKFALEGMSESLAYELEPSGVRVALIEPGAYATALGAAPQAAAAPSAYPAFERLRHERALRASSGADPADAARVIVDTILRQAPQLRVPCGAQAQTVTARLRTLDAAQRREFALAVAGISAPLPP